MRQCVLDNFKVEVIEECETQEKANHQERFWIKVLNCKIPDGYNRSSGGEGHVIKTKTTSENSAKAMKLGEIIREYRLRNHMSWATLQRRLALASRIFQCWRQIKVQVPASRLS